MPPIVPLEAEIVFDQTLPDPLFRTYARLLGRAWDGQQARALDYNLEDLRGLLGNASRPAARSVVFAHLRDLRLAKLITWTTNGRGRYHITFPPTAPPRLTQPDRPGPLPGTHPQPATAPTHSAAPPALLPVRKSRLGGQSESPDLNTVVVVKDPPPKNEVSTTTTTTSENSDAPEPDRRRGALEALGLWPQTAAELATRVNLRAALAWAAYCADPAQAIANPAGLLAANLKAGRPAPEAYLPPLFCRRCDRAAPACVCRQAPDLFLPVESYLHALAHPPNLYAGFDRWGVCLTCHALPCQCQEESSHER